jgi:hypothetical protein
MDVNVIVTSILSSGGVSAIIGFWIKTTIKHEYDVRLEAYKAQVRAEADSTLERLKADLQITANEHHVRYSKIFETQAQIISETYGKLIALRNAVARYVHPVSVENTPTLEERRKVVAAAHTDFQQYFEPRELFLPDETAKQIQEFSGKLHRTAFEFLYTVESDVGRHKNKIEHWKEAWDFVEKDIPQLLGRLKSDFRDRLGISGAMR